MAFIKKTYEEIRDDILAQITKGVVNEKHVYEPSQIKLKLLNSPVKDIIKITGTVKGSKYNFIKGVDFRLSGDMLEWLSNGTRPDEKTDFFVNYSIVGSSTISDVNPGSVSRTLVESISREIEFLYDKLNYVYLSAFLETATGSALDLTVSLLGIDRKDAESATGQVTFGRSTDPEEITVNQEAHVFDNRTSYNLIRDQVKNILQLEGTHKGEAIIFELDTDYIIFNNVIEWLKDGKKPDNKAPFFVDYTTFEDISIPIGTRVSTYAQRAEDMKIFETIEPGTLTKNLQGKWEANIRIRAVEAGTKGNVYAGTVNVMPQPLTGVEYVLNRTDILTGVETETDDDLRERARHALEMAGKATKTSLESAVKGLEGVTSILVVDMPDGVAGIVKIVAQGGNDDQIMKVINDTRAAGIRVEFKRPRIVYIDTSINIVVRTWLSTSEQAVAKKDVESKIREYLSSLNIGEDVTFNRVLKNAFDVKGVHDVKELAITSTTEGKESFTSNRENIELSQDEIAQARDINISITVME